MNKDTEMTIVSMLSKIPELWRQRSDSLEEFVAITKNEHITLIEEHLTSLDYLPALLDKIQIHLGSNMIAAISILVGVPQVDVMDILDKVSTKRDPLGTAIKSGSRLGTFIAGESTRIGLPAYERLPLLALESSRGNNGNGNRTTHINNPVQTHRDEVSHHDVYHNHFEDKHVEFHDRHLDRSVTNIDRSTNNYDNTKGKSATSFGKDTLRNLHDVGSLSTGKQFEILFERDGNKAPVIMTLSLAVKSLPTQDIKPILAFSDQMNTFTERLLRAKAGELSWMKDIIFCNDLIDKARKERYRDRTGYYREMMDRRTKNWLSGLLSFNMSINNASSVMVIDQETADSLTAELGGTLEDIEVRNRVFKDTLTVFIAVIDVRWGRVKIFHRGSTTFTTVEASDLKGSKSSGKSTNVDDIITAYRSGATPSF